MENIEQVPAALASTSFFKKKWVQNACWVIATIAIMYAMVFVDVCMRAREAYWEGEKYWDWHEHPEKKSKEILAKFEKSKIELEKKKNENKITELELKRQMEILEFDRNKNLEESSIKYAYVWYKTAYELFSPPESKWVRLSREKAVLAREKWKEELRSKNIPFEEYMLD